MKRKIYIIGIGESGFWAAVLAKMKTVFPVIAVDENEGSRKVADYAGMLKNKGVKCFLGRDAQKISPEIGDLVVVSPGIDLKNSNFRFLLDSGAELISEIEFASGFLKNLYSIGVTGTNGKTTVVKMSEYVLKEKGLYCRSAGNIGYPLSRFVVNFDGLEKAVIVELSSFQLELTKSKFLDAAVITNISNDHMDRYDNFLQYVKAKLNILNLVKESGRGILDKNISEKYAELLNFPDIIAVSANNDIGGRRIVVFDDRIEIEEKGYGKKVFKREEFNFVGVHNFMNALFAFFAVEKLGVDAGFFFDSIKDFKLPEHRLEIFYRKGRLVFVNDSKSTTPESTVAAVNSFSEKVFLIAGGRDKKMDFSSLKTLERSKLERVYLIGETKEKLGRIFADFTSVCLCDSLEEAVGKALKDAGDCGVILFSPACASFDMFENYEERGNVFKRLTEKLVA